MPLSKMLFNGTGLRAWFNREMPPGCYYFFYIYKFFASSGSQTYMVIIPFDIIRVYIWPICRNSNSMRVFMAPLVCLMVHNSFGAHPSWHILTIENIFCFLLGPSPPMSLLWLMVPFGLMIYAAHTIPGPSFFLWIATFSFSLLLNIFAMKPVSSFNVSFALVPKIYFFILTGGYSTATFGGCIWVYFTNCTYIGAWGCSSVFFLFFKNPNIWCFFESCLNFEILKLKFFNCEKYNQKNAKSGTSIESQ